MQKFRFFGFNTEIDGTKLTRIGDTISLTEELAKDAIHGGALLLPEELFESIGFSAKKMPDPSTNHEKYLEFLRQREEAIELMGQWLKGELPRASESAPAE